jgi:NADPH:quinone reductase-like Zn-dependent oxidoreductase
MRRIKKQLTVITRKKEAWLESRDKLSLLAKAYGEALAIDLISASEEELEKTVKEYTQIEQFRCIVDETNLKTIDANIDKVEYWISVL